MAHGLEVAASNLGGNGAPVTCGAAGTCFLSCWLATRRIARRLAASGLMVATFDSHHGDAVRPPFAGYAPIMSLTIAPARSFLQHV